MSAQRELNPSEFTDQQLRTMALALVPHLNRFGIEERPYRQDEIAQLLGCSKKHVIHLTNEGLIKAYRFEGYSTPYYYPSEINKTLRKTR